MESVVVYLDLAEKIAVNLRKLLIYLRTIVTIMEYFLLGNAFATRALLDQPVIRRRSNLVNPTKIVQTTYAKAKYNRYVPKY